ncbi:L,D-transpeptidase family protein [Longispora albida]|uniref:L,D-transpeptidase family protein n=1 Tax=Longispora albida TaxID=203523 RepID=UPI0003731BF9|nr:L,D-transpeptidase [Longispora albida]
MPLRAFRISAVVAAVVAAAVLGGVSAYAISAEPDARFQPVAATSSPAPAPSTPATTTPPPVTVGHSGACEAGEKQREVEDLLTKIGGFGPITADGYQSDQDCTTIKAFQKRYDIRPASGRPGPLTHGIAQRIAAFDPARCEAGPGLTACVDLTNQITWAMRDGQVVLGPTVVRTGMAGGFQTPAGKYALDRKNNPEWSVPYKVNLPYFQHFLNGMGFHETTTWIHDSFGSHGCINMLPGDVKALWDMTKVGTPVHLWGRRPGT